MATFPSDSLARVSAIVHRYDRKEGAFTLEAIIGGVTSDYGIPSWSSMPQSAEPVYAQEVAEQALVEKIHNIIIKAKAEGKYYLRGLNIPTDMRYFFRDLTDEEFYWLMKNDDLQKELSKQYGTYK